MGFFNRIIKKKEQPENNSDLPKGKKHSAAEEAAPYKFDGLKALRIGNIRYAVMVLERALEIHPEFETRYYYALSLQRSGKAEEALVQYDELLKEVPDHFLVLSERAALLLQQDDLEAAESDARKALELAENEDEQTTAHRLLAQILNASGRYEESVAEAEAALAISPQDSVCALTKTKALVSAERHDSALAYIAQAKTEFPEEERFLLYEAYVYEKDGDAPKATETFEQALQIDPFNEEALLGIVRILLSLDNPEEALRRVKDFSEVGTISPRMKGVYADLLRKSGNEAEAQKVEQTLLEENETSPVQFNDLYKGGIY